MSSYPRRSNEAGGMIAGSDWVWKQTVFFLHHVVSADVSLSIEKSSEVGIPCTFRRDFSNGDEYFAGSDNTFIPLAAFTNNGINGYRHKCKIYKCLSACSWSLWFMMGYQLCVEHCGWEHLVIRVILIRKLRLNLSILCIIGFVCTEYIYSEKGPRARPSDCSHRSLWYVICRIKQQQYPNVSPLYLTQHGSKTHLETAWKY